MLESTARILVLVLHVAAASILVGSSLTAPLLRRSLLSASSLGSLRTWLDIHRHASAAHPVAAMLLLGSGLYLGASGWWTQPWFFVSIATWVVSLIVAVRVKERSACALASAVGSREGPVDEEVDALRRARPWPLAEAILRGGDLAMLYVMFAKPSLVVALVAVAGAMLASAVAAALGRRAPAALPAPAPRRAET